MDIADELSTVVVHLELSGIDNPDEPVVARDELSIEVQGRAGVDLAVGEQGNIVYILRPTAAGDVDVERRRAEVARDTGAGEMAKVGTVIEPQVVISRTQPHVD